PEAESGTPLPERREMNATARGSYRDGLRAAQGGNLDAARAAFQRALDADPRAFKAAYNLGVVAQRSGQVDQALDHYRAALRIQADYEKAAEGIVSIYVARGSVPDAVAFIEPLARQ